MEKVKKLMEAGLSLSDAIKHALGMDLGRFSEKYDLVRVTATNVVNSRQVPTDKYINAFVAELGGTPGDWRLMLWEAAKPATTSAA